MITMPDSKSRLTNRPLPMPPQVQAPSLSASSDSEIIHKMLTAVASQQRSPSSMPPPLSKKEVIPIEERLYDALADAKTTTAQIAMHFDGDWRDRLFHQLDTLLEADAWHSDDQPFGAESYLTFLRILLLIRPLRRPGLGVSNAGNLIAAWTRGDDRLTIECLPQDKARWVVACTIDGDRELAAGDTAVARLPETLAPYRPERWFRDAGDLPTTR